MYCHLQQCFCNLCKTIRHCNVACDIYNLKLVINLVGNTWIPYNDIFLKICPWKNENLGRGMFPRELCWGFHVPSFSRQLGWKVAQVKLGNFVKCLSSREFASPCSPMATFLLEEVAWELHSLFHPSQN